MKNINHKKKMAQLKYLDLILKLRESGISYDKITQNINMRLSKSKLKVSLSKSTIINLIKKYT